MSALRTEPVMYPRTGGDMRFNKWSEPIFE